MCYNLIWTECDWHRQMGLRWEGKLKDLFGNCGPTFNKVSSFCFSREMEKECWVYPLSRSLLSTETDVHRGVRGDKKNPPRKKCQKMSIKV